MCRGGVGSFIELHSLNVVQRLETEERQRKIKDCVERDGCGGCLIHKTSDHQLHVVTQTNQGNTE